MPTRSQVQSWDTTALDDATQRWRGAAAAAETAFEQHRQNIASPGGTDWEGDAKDAALDRVAADLGVVRRQGDVQRHAADVAARGGEDISAARGAVLDAIAEAEADDFLVGEDLSVTDTREFDPMTAAARATAAAEHAEYIRWRAEQLVATDALVGQQLQAQALELQGIQFDGEGRDESIQLVDHKTDAGGPDSDQRPQTWQDMLRPPGTSTGEAAYGGTNKAAEGVGGAPSSPLDDMLVPEKTTDREQPANLDDALDDVAGQPVPENPSAVDQVINQHTGRGHSDTRYTRSPLEAPIVGADPSVVDEQLARVETARSDLDSAQAALDNAAGNSYTQGAAAGPGRGETVPLSQAVFDARRELTDQVRILESLNQAASEAGTPTAEVPDLPPNADVQAFPPEPSAFAEGSRALSEGTFGLVPDVAHDIDVLTNWGEHSGADQAGAVLDVAGMAPIPGGKFFAEGLEHGVDALAGSARHSDDIPTPDIDVPHLGSGDIADITPFGIEDARALLEASEASGGHLIERHVGQTFDDLSTRLANSPRLSEVSTFASVDEAATAAITALQHNQAAVDTWITEGARKTLTISAPFEGGQVLSRGGVESITGSSVKVVLKGDGMGNWSILTGYVQP